MTTVEDPLKQQRRHIDRIDKTIVALVAERRRLRDGSVGPLAPASAERVLAVVNEESEVVPDEG